MREEGQVKAAVEKLRADAAPSVIDDVKYVGVDTEWYNPRVKGISPTKTALVQICSSPGYCAVFLIAVLGKVPASLWSFLCDSSIRKVGTSYVIVSGVD